MTITTLIADDEALVRAGLRMIIEAQPDMAVVAEAGDGAAAVEAIVSRQPDVALLDIQMPRLDGLEATRRVTQDPSLTRTRILVLTTFGSDHHVYEALNKGASGFLLKDTPPEALADAIRTIASGQALVGPEILTRLIEEFTRRPAPAPATAPELRDLSERERQVLRLIARGYTNAEIAAELFLAETTVKSHVGRIFSKLALRDRVQAVILGYRTGLVTPADRP